MGKVRKIELLSPAKDLNCGMEAVNHGADAVYIGAPKFGARAAAGNSLEDIRRLCDYAHLFGVRIYVALNTILKEDELDEARRLVWSLYEAGADALIVQDMQNDFMADGALPVAGAETVMAPIAATIPTAVCMPAHMNTPTIRP